VMGIPGQLEVVAANFRFIHDVSCPHDMTCHAWASMDATGPLLGCWCTPQAGQHEHASHGDATAALTRASLA